MHFVCYHRSGCCELGAKGTLSASVSIRSRTGEDSGMCFYFLSFVFSFESKMSLYLSSYWHACCSKFCHPELENIPTFQTLFPLVHHTLTLWVLGLAQFPSLYLTEPGDPCKVFAEPDLVRWCQPLVYRVLSLLSWQIFWFWGPRPCCYKSRWVCTELGEAECSGRALDAQWLSGASEDSSRKTERIHPWEWVIKVWRAGQCPELVVTGKPWLGGSAESGTRLEAPELK